MSSSTNTSDSRDFQSVLDRLKAELGLGTNKGLAVALGLTATNLGERKSRDALPRPQIDALCEREGLSPHWVYTGEGVARPLGSGKAPEAARRMREARGSYAPPLDAVLLAKVVTAIDQAVEERGLKFGVDRRARLYAGLYELSLPSKKVNLAAIGPLLEVARTAGG